MLHFAEWVPKLQRDKPRILKRPFLSSLYDWVLTGTASESWKIAKVLEITIMLLSAQWKKRYMAKLGNPVTTMKSVEALLRVDVDT